MSTLFRLNLLLVAAFHAIPLTAKDGGPIIITDGQDSFPVGWNFSYYEDKKNDRNVDKIIELDRLGAFNSNGEMLKGKAYSDSSFWLKFVIENRSGNEEWFLDLVSPIQETFDVYPMTDKGLPLPAAVKTGRYHLIKLKIPSGTSATVYVKIFCYVLYDFQMNIKSDDGVKERDLVQTYIVGFIAGCFASLFIYNIFIFFALRDRHYFYYILFLLVNCIIALISVNFPDGIARSYGISLTYWVPLYRPLAPVTSYLFAMSFLQTKKAQPLLHKAFVGFIWLMLGLMMLFLVFPNTRTSINSCLDPLFFASFAIPMTAGIRSFRGGFRPALYYLLAYIVFIGGIIVIILSLNGVIPSNYFTNEAHLFGQALEMLLMSLALADKIKVIDRERISTKIQAAESRKLQSLLRIIVHDLANPISVINYHVNKMIRVDRGNISLNKIRQSLSVIMDIIKYSRTNPILKPKDTAFRLEKVYVAEVFENLGIMFEKKASHKGVTLEFLLEDDNAAVIAERTTFLISVMGNLIDNALKFSYSGGSVTVHHKKEGNTGVIKVTDAGRGIRESIMKNIFDPINNTSTKGTSGEEGSGFGIPIVKQIVEKYEGKISIESITVEDDAHNHGTTITIILKDGG
ncbi:MAG: sensor histidine kinase [Oligoflexales bacterium]|nr:sensor histidine kinase [Oligoflexales bacterium]